MAGLGSLQQLQERYGVGATPVRRVGQKRKYHTLEELQEARKRWKADAEARRVARIAARKADPDYVPKKRGRPPKFTPEEKAERKRWAARQNYLRKVGKPITPAKPRLPPMPANKKTLITEEQREQHTRDVRARYQRSRFTHLKEDGILTRVSVRAMDAGEAHEAMVFDAMQTLADGTRLGHRGYLGLGAGCYQAASHRRDDRW